jgi:Raf kinase inhibitor-like YbhB/YbcL family protein
LEEKDMELSSPSFENGETIPIKYTKKGENISPPLIFSNVPENAKSLVLIMDDPGGPLITFVHWLVWNIPPNTTKIMEREKIIYPQGKNTLRKHGYVGPCPPFGTHRYFFKLYALDKTIDLEPGANKKKLERAISKHIIAEAKLIGNSKK